MTTPELLAAAETIRKYDANPPKTTIEILERGEAWRTVLSAGPSVRHLNFSQIRPSPLRWLWPGHIPLGKLTLLAGDPGTGKSFLTLDIATRLSRNLPWPGEQTSGDQTLGTQASGAQASGFRQDKNPTTDTASPPSSSLHPPSSSDPPSSSLRPPSSSSAPSSDPGLRTLDSGPPPSDPPSSSLRPPSSPSAPSSDPGLRTLDSGPPPSDSPPSSLASPLAADTILLNGEDDLADTLRPRLEAAGADLKRIHIIEEVRDDELNWLPWTLRDIQHLEKMLADLPAVRLVVLDPLAAFTSRTGRTETEARRLLAPLARLAARKGVAIVAVTHLRKATAGRALHRLMGSLAYASLPRAVSLVARDPADPARRLFLPVKQNLSANPAGLAFRIVDDRIEWEPRAVRITADQAINTDLSPEDGDPTAVERAARWLLEMLADGPQPARTIRHAALDCGISYGALRRAKDLLGVSITKDGYQGIWHWSLPG